MREEKKIKSKLIDCKQAVKWHESSIVSLLKRQMGFLIELESYEELIYTCRKLLFFNSKDPQVWHNLGFALAAIKCYKEAVETFQKGIDLKSDILWHTMWSQSYVVLLQGHLKRGFELNESRLMAYKTKSLVKAVKQSYRWQGEDISGKTLLIHHDGGFGDSIQFLRYVKYLKKYNCNPILFLQPELNCLFDHIGIPLIHDQNCAIEYDVHVFILSFPYCFNTNFSNIPPPVKLACHRKPIKGRIGIVWKAGLDKENSHKDKRSLDLKALVDLFKLPGLHYVCAQKEVNEKDVKILEENGIERPIIHSFVDTLKILEECEKVICVDTSVAHLSASMGIPTWILLSYNACWRWFIDRTDSPWYPSATLFRQKRANDWNEPVRQVEKQLKNSMNSSL